MNQYEQTMATEYLYSEPTPTVTVETGKITEKGTGTYRFLALLFFLFAVGGLFIGMLSVLIEGFRHAAYVISPAEDSVFNSSLLGIIVYVFGNFGAICEDLSAMYVNPFLGINYTINLALLLLIAVSVILSLVMMIVAFVSRTKAGARRCAMVSGIVAFLAYCGYFLFTYYSFTFATAPISSDVSPFDYPALSIAGALLVILIVTAIARNGAMGLVSTLLLLLTIGAAMALSYPYSATSELAYTAANYVTASVFVGCTLVALMAMITINFIVTTIRLNAKRAFAFDMLRYAVQLIALLLFIVAMIVAAPEDNRWEIFTAEGQVIATSVLLAATVLAFVLTLLVVILKGRTKNVTAVVEVPAAGYVEPRPAVTQVYEPAYIRVAPPVEYVQPVIQPVVQQPIVQQPIVQQPIVQQPAPQPAAQPVQQTVTNNKETQHTHTETVIVKEKPRPDVPVTEFERRMQAIAHGETPVYHYDTTPAQQPTGKAAKASKASATQTTQTQTQTRTTKNSYVYEGSQYMYDPFIKTLSPQEKNEFGDLFIANIYGLHSYLPTYVIGGDNKIFFDRVFIYLGCYRHYISQELLEKIYLYINKQ